MNGDSPWWTRQDLITFTWDLWYSCNYRCSYCWWELDHLWDKLAEQNRVLAPEAWAAIWERIYARCGSARLDIIGGEPMIYPRFDELVGLLCRQHYVCVTTNLSLPREKILAIADKTAGGRLHVNASFHPEYADREEFAGKVLALKEGGVSIDATIVTWPPFVDQLASWRRFFHDKGIGFSLQIFRGTWNGQYFPDAYDARQKEVIETFLIDGPFREREVKYRLERLPTLGKLCHSGRVYANIKGNGDVFRCGQGGAPSRMGNIIDDDFTLYDAPKPCPYERCNCQEYKYLDQSEA